MLSSSAPTVSIHLRLSIDFPATSYKGRVVSSPVGVHVKLPFASKTGVPSHTQFVGLLTKVKLLVTGDSLVAGTSVISTHSQGIPIL